MGVKDVTNNIKVKRQKWGSGKTDSDSDSSSDRSNKPGPNVESKSDAASRAETGASRRGNSR